MTEGPRLNLFTKKITASVYKMLLLFEVFGGVPGFPCPCGICAYKAFCPISCSEKPPLY